MKLVQEWLRDFNTADNDVILAMAGDKNGNIYIVGWSEPVDMGADEMLAQVQHTNGAPQVRKGVPAKQPPRTNAPSHAWLTKYTRNGVFAWSKKLTENVDGLAVVLATDDQNNIWVAANSYHDPAWLGKYGERGNQMWRRELELPAYRIMAITTDRQNNVYLAGNVGGIDAANAQNWLAKFDNNGRRELVINDVGRIREMSSDVRSNIVVAGKTDKGVFVAKYSSELVEDWRRQLDSGESEDINSIAADPDGSVYIVGETDGEFSKGERAGGMDAWMAKYGVDGQRRFLRHITSSSGDDVAMSVTCDAAGYVYVAGHTSGELIAGAASGERDVWLAKYLPNGDELWRYQMGITDDDTVEGVALDSDGNIYMVGTTDPNGSFANDGWVGRYREEAETVGEMWALVNARMSK
jgi:hypothetical protein